MDYRYVGTTEEKSMLAKKLFVLKFTFKRITMKFKVNDVIWDSECDVFWPHGRIMKILAFDGTYYEYAVWHQSIGDFGNFFSCFGTGSTTYANSVLIKDFETFKLIYC